MITGTISKMNFTNVSFHSFGYELPPDILTSKEIEHRLRPVYERLRLPEGRLELMSGIAERLLPGRISILSR